MSSLVSCSTRHVGVNISGKRVLVIHTVLLSKSQVASLITMKDVIEITDRTYKDIGNGKVVNPTKVCLDMGIENDFPKYNADINAMPAYVDWVDMAGLKWGGGWLDNPAKGLPYMTALQFMVDPHNGDYLGVIEAGYLTDLRTGAQNAVTLGYICKKKSIVMGLYGAGAQGRTQAEAIGNVFRIDELKVYDVSHAAAEKFVADMRAKNVVPGKITIVDKPEEAAASADIVVSVTHARDGFFKRDWFAPGMIYCPLGSYKECEDAVPLAADKIFAGHIGQVLHRGALKSLVDQGKITENNITALHGDIAAGKSSVEIRSDERVMNLTCGMGAIDVAVGAVLLKRAKERGVGEEFNFMS